MSILGKSNSRDISIEISRLVETRLLVQANSGGGKSWALRRILEQTSAEIQQIIIDPEGEFSTIREKGDYIVCAPRGADACAHPRTAALLARRLLEVKVSAVVDIYELKAHERQAFVRLFLDALVNAPRELWHPCLVVIDEAHIFCPEKGHAESTSAVIDLATRGRKRGMGAILATQRLSKLHKDAAAEMLNKLIGRTGLDIDVKRAADELGMTSKEAVTTLRDLAPGEFFAFGPALSSAVTRVKVGPVATTHPKIGERHLSAPRAPSLRIRRILSELADLPKEAEAEAKTLADLKAENVILKRELAMTKKAASSGVPETEVVRRERAAAARVAQEAKALAPNGDPSHVKAIEKILNIAQKAIGTCGDRLAVSPDARRSVVAARTDSQLRAGVVRILKELAARAPAGYSKSQVATLTGFSSSSGTFSTYLGDLRRTGFIEERSGLIHATDAGIRYLGDQVPAAATSHEEAMALWRKALRAGAYRMLQATVAAGAAGITRAALATTVGMVPSSGTFSTYLGDLRRNGLIEERNGVSLASSILFPGA